MASLGGRVALGAGSFGHVGGRPRLLVRTLEQLGERKLHVGMTRSTRGDPCASLQGTVERMLVKPGRCLRGSQRKRFSRGIRRREVAEQTRLLEPRFAVRGNLHAQEPLVDT